MKIALYQQDIVWNNPTANFRKVASVLEQLDGCDLLVLPEMFTRGFVLNPQVAGVRSADYELEQMKALAWQYGCAVAGSVPVRVRQSFFNRFFFVYPDGDRVFADKRHLFTHGGENLHYRAGRERVVAEYKGVRFLLTVCYDLRFPVWCRCREDYDVLLCVANWPSARRPAWDILLRARAVENQCYAVGVNRVGEDALCPYSGGSMVVHPYGDVMAACADGVEDCVACTIDMEALRDYRAKFPSLRDADHFGIYVGR